MFWVQGQTFVTFEDALNFFVKNGGEESESLESIFMEDEAE